VGRRLHTWLGIGAAAVPLIPLYWSISLFGHLDRSLAKRVTILLVGLAITVPFAAGVLYQAIEGDLRDAMDAGRALWVGQVGGALAFELRRPLGVVGEALVALAAFSVLTIVTVGWNPLGALRKRERGEGAGETEALGGEAPLLEAPADSVIAAHEFAAVAAAPPPRERRRRKKPAGAVGVVGAGVPEDDELPPLELLDQAAEEAASFEVELDRLQGVLIDTLTQFKVEAKPGGRTVGPVVTQFEVIPDPGVKVGRIAALADDLALALKAPSIRIVAPIPGKGAVGVEVPNPTPRLVGLRKLLESPQFARTNFQLPIVLGEDLEGRPIVAELAKMPHLLIAGTTGSGKSVCINAIITSLVYYYTKDRLRMLMIDPKMVELSMYQNLPHLRHAVVTDNKDAAKVFKWAVWEMQDRYELLHANTARNIVDFNRKVEAAEPLKLPDGQPYTAGVLPYVVLFVDELADLMMTVQAEVETPLALLAQKARAIGIHVVLATQRPSVNVVTGLIKANFPSRIAFRVASKIDSRTILDQNGAEALLGSGDMLFMLPGRNDLLRIQGAYITTEETERLMAWYEERRAARVAAAQAEATAGLEEPDILEVVRVRAAEEEGGEDVEGGGAPEERDRLFRQAAEICIQAQGGSTSLLQRRLKIGYGRAARIIDQLEEAGVLSPADGPRGRDVLVGLDDVERICGE
jgi:S-DNA-T family DNA segregation ATPase FtsK/SpoIIIE